MLFMDVPLSAMQLRNGVFSYIYRGFFSPFLDPNSFFGVGRPIALFWIGF